MLFFDFGVVNRGVCIFGSLGGLLLNSELGRGGTILGLRELGDFQTEGIALRSDGISCVLV